MGVVKKSGNIDFISFNGSNGLKSSKSFKGLKSVLGTPLASILCQACARFNPRPQNIGSAKPTDPQVADFINPLKLVSSIWYLVSRYSSLDTRY